MNYFVLIVLLYLVLAVLLLILLVALFRIKKINDKVNSIDLSSEDLDNFMEEIQTLLFDKDRFVSNLSNKNEQKEPQQDMFETAIQQFEEQEEKHNLFHDDRVQEKQASEDIGEEPDDNLVGIINEFQQQDFSNELEIDTKQKNSDEYLQELDKVNIPSQKTGNSKHTNLKEQIIMLHQQGLSSEEISNKLGISNTEAQLIIKML